jgi:hypothetical protein
VRRELRSVATEEMLGAVDDAKGPPFEGDAGDVLKGLRREVGDVKASEIVLAEGWSNGYLYFGDLITP